jgi:hypothetical protein
MSLRIGHGWVRKIYGGVVARCGGPAICCECADELRLLTRAVKELFYWQYSTWTPWFHYHLYDLISRADFHNRMRIEVGFPWEMEAFTQWEAAHDCDEFFRQFGLDRSALTSSSTKIEGRESAERQ